MGAAAHALVRQMIGGPSGQVVRELLRVVGLLVYPASRLGVRHHGVDPMVALCERGPQAADPESGTVVVQDYSENGRLES